MKAKKIHAKDCPANRKTGNAHSPCRTPFCPANAATWEHLAASFHAVIHHRGGIFYKPEQAAPGRWTVGAFSTGTGLSFMCFYWPRRGEREALGLGKIGARLYVGKTVSDVEVATSLVKHLCALSEVRIAHWGSDERTPSMVLFCLRDILGRF